MLSKMNPFCIVKAHFATLRSYDSDEISKPEMILHIFFPLVFSLIQYKWGSDLSENTISILVSAASIFAGLMLNLLVLIYTLVYNNKQNSKIISNYKDFIKLCKETLSTISYSVFMCIILVISCFASLSEVEIIKLTGHIGSIYFSVSVILCLLIVLKRCYTIIQFDLN